MNEKFDLEYHYQKYLKRIKLEEKNMLPIQKIQLRQTFFAACGIMLIILRDEVGLLDEEEGVAIMQDMLHQVSNQLLKQKNRNN